jgi:hypothetical protein
MNSCSIRFAVALAGIELYGQRSLPQIAHLVASVGHDLGCRVCVGLAAVGEHDVLPYADTACDGLTDLAGSDDNDDAPCTVSFEKSASRALRSTAVNCTSSAPRFSRKWSLHGAVTCQREEVGDGEGSDERHDGVRRGQAPRR